MAAKKKKLKVETKKVPKDKVALVREITEQLLGLMGTKAVPTVTEDKENQAVFVDIQTDEEAGLLIGNRGENLVSLQTIIGMVFRKKFGEWQRIIVNVSDWRKKQEERLRELALQTAQRAKDTSEPQALYNLTPAQRRIIHLVLAGDEEVETESLGEGIERYLVVRLKGK